MTPEIVCAFVGTRLRIWIVALLKLPAKFKLVNPPPFPEKVPEAVMFTKLIFVGVKLRFVRPDPFPVKDPLATMLLNNAPDFMEMSFSAGLEKNCDGSKLLNVGFAAIADSDQTESRIDRKNFMVQFQV